MAEAGPHRRRVLLLDRGWSLCATAPGAAATPAALEAAGPTWGPALVPGTVAQALDLGVEGGVDLDGQDWWYRCRFAPPPELDGGRLALCFEGLATLAEVWLDGALLLSSRNMFRAHRVPLAGPLRPEHTLHLCFRSLDAELARKRPRPRWKTALVDHQDLRWVRTTLLGRMPGWTPPLHAVGPWRPVTLEAAPPVDLVDLVVRPSAEGGVARLRLSATLDAAQGCVPTAATLHVGEARHALPLSPGGRLEAGLALPGLPLWWPHTQGEPHLHDCSLVLQTSLGPVAHDLGRLGFRAVAMDRSGGRVQLVVNGRPVFCRGACWTAEDMRSLDGAPGRVAATLALAREGGLDMLRLGGTMTWGSAELYEACDALGILVWQDLMFANMDLPLSDPDFAAEVRAEVEGWLCRLQRRACLAVYCGGSETQQQAAMLGLPPAEWSHPFFEQQVPALLARHHPGVPWFPATPCEGPLPFHTGVGVCHYYGVGAYRRPLSDLRTAGVRFAAECLAFAQVPQDENLRLAMRGARPVPHHPLWKAGVPRDNGAGWDFEDTRDHYLALLYGVDPTALRSRDPERYLALSRAVTGELMLRAYAEWRRPGSGCGGALVWFLKDLRPGAGWGIIDSTGRPKAAWWALRRAWARQAVLLTDEGLDGLGVHVHNETGQALRCTVELELLRAARHRVGHARRVLELPSWQSLSLSGDELLGAFTDLGQAYRFGPPGHDVVIARLRAGEDGPLLHQDAFFPLGHGLPVLEDAGLRATATARDDGAVALALCCDAFLQGVSLSAPGWWPEDDHFHLAPGLPRTLLLRPEPGARPFRAQVGALNLARTVTVRAG